MPRIPRQQRAKSTVDSIVEAGFISLSRHGLAGTTTKHIADIAGVSVGSLYEYFRNKEAIYEAMQARFVRDLIGVLQPLTPRIVRLPLTEAIPVLLYDVQALLLRDDQRYLRYAREVFNADVRFELNDVSRSLGDIVVQYLLHNPQYAGLQRLAAMSYIFVNAGMYTVIRHMSDPNPPVTYDDLVDGLAHMVSHYVRMERQLARRQQAASEGGVAHRP
ncbi:TetR family transcriptional regulator [Aquabacterium fontiphilum]|jgi:AcrR family transcriptional regulator|uniref:TetR/AcrR family transcriptional regulator n=1 Tax=Aquabacterium fontiphilum TaxID=450365 RepID=UPI0013764B25|nr:TetR/AcrR family transcriptional regulator [Aquabacterium fontiphilum]NBD19737.1 TetR family transcriptional regulator [Aquabacterium fontiphilum]